VREAAAFRWPWWYMAATAALILTISAAMDFDELIHVPTRLSIVALLSAALQQLIGHADAVTP
jgi:hypothetical protein